uniref:Uncharacterized protein n=1 Tax=Steinernema glaseri TaxID=37863 RepID=A0A1I7ZIJ5_9BILA
MIIIHTPLPSVTITKIQIRNATSIGYAHRPRKQLAARHSSEWVAVATPCGRLILCKPVHSINTRRPSAIGTKTYQRLLDTL